MSSIGVSARTQSEVACLCASDPEVPEALVGACLSPLELLFSAICTFNNSWCIAARFGSAPVDCLSVCRHAGGDCMTHLIRSPVLIDYCKLAAFAWRRATGRSPNCTSSSGVGIAWPRCRQHAIFADVVLWWADQSHNRTATRPRALMTSNQYFGMRRCGALFLRRSCLSVRVSVSDLL